MRSVSILVALSTLVVWGVAAQATAFPPHPAGTQSQPPVYTPFADVKWEPILPALGAGSPEIAILHVDPTTKATALMIRVPANFHVTKHWHTANETHTVVSGTFIMEDHGRRVELGPGSFNYMPSRMIHEAWTRPDQGTVLFITVDGAWDVNWVEGPPTAPRPPAR